MGARGARDMVRAAGGPLVRGTGRARPLMQGLVTICECLPANSYRGKSYRNCFRTYLPMHTNAERKD